MALDLGQSPGQLLNTEMTIFSLVEVDMCKVPPLCHSYASCSTIHEPTVEKNCTCLVGYHGDGYVCGPVNPCQLDNGGCPFETSRCIYDSPGKVSSINLIT